MVLIMPGHYIFIMYIYVYICIIYIFNIVLNLNNLFMNFRIFKISRIYLSYALDLLVFMI